MQLAPVAFALITVSSLFLLPLPSAVSTVLSLSISVAIERAANGHLSGRSDVLQRLRRRKYVCMSIGAILQCLSIGVLSLTLMTPVFIVMFRGMKHIPDASDPDFMQFVQLQQQRTEQFLQSLPDVAWGWDILLSSLALLPVFVVAVMTPWILTIDYSHITLIHSHVEDLTHEMIVRDIMAFGITGAVGIALFHILFPWLVKVIIAFIESPLPTISAVSSTDAISTALRVLQILRISVTILVVQLTFCIAVAERDVLARNRRVWFAFTYCTAVFAPFYFENAIAATVPGLKRLPSWVWKLVATIVAFGFFEHCRRRYMSLLAVARLKDAENILSAVPPLPSVEHSMQGMDEEAMPMMLAVLNVAQE